MAMRIPDYALVAEVMLFAEGFEDAKTRSRKMSRCVAGTVRWQGQRGGARGVYFFCRARAFGGHCPGSHDQKSLDRS